MKKTLVMFLFLLCLCGCSKRLTCTYIEKYDDIKIENKMVFNLKTKKYEKTDKMIFSDSASANKYYNDIIEYKDEYNLKLDKNIIYSKTKDNIKLDRNKLQLKDQYESYGYKCQ